MARGGYHPSVRASAPPSPCRKEFGGAARQASTPQATACRGRPLGVPTALELLEQCAPPRGQRPAPNQSGVAGAGSGAGHELGAVAAVDRLACGGRTAGGAYLCHVSPALGSGNSLNANDKNEDVRWWGRWGSHSGSPP